ncbi:MAG TPA: DEAD/DEAH box helicase, partial [Acidimicrobiales bacterium]
RRAEEAGRWDGLVAHLDTLAPGAFEPSSDLAGLLDLAARATSADGTGWWARWRKRRAMRRLLRMLGAAPGTPPGDLRTALTCAGDRRAKARLESTGGTVLVPTWAQLGAADAALRLAAGRLVEAQGAAEDRRRQGRRAIGDLGTALRAGRRQRRRLLRDIDGKGVVTALPLWVGTARDVDDLLPDTPALFDLAILDEASQIDQPSAAGVLLRARRAVVVGDPHQLRHVSFVSDAEVERSLTAHGLTSWAARLDVRRTSILDLAAGTAPVVWLDEHHRSVPHLIEFSARRFYDGRLHIATRHPANEAADVIEVERPAGGAGEVDAALAVIDRLAGSGLTDIAVISPFRDVADAAQAALLARYDLDDVERLGLRVGTVHAFQGGEADHVVLVLGLAADDPPGRRRFVEDPNLFNVMVTRARRSCVVVTTLPTPTGPPDGLVERYLIHAERPPAPPRTGPCPSEWGEALARELHHGGVAVRTGYPVGRWIVDLCAGEGAAAVAVETSVHPDGPAAHMARHRALVAAGWRLLDGYPTIWDHDPTRAALELADALDAT